MLTTKQLSLLNDFSTQVARCTRLDDYVSLGLDMAVRLLAVEASVIFLKKTDGLVIHSHRGFSPRETDPALTACNKLSYRTAESGRTVVIDGAGAGDDADLFAGYDAPKTLVVVPLISCGRVLGTLAASGITERTFNQVEISLLETLGSQLGLAMENSILHTRQSAIKARLRESERQFQELFEKTSDIIWVEDLEGHILSANHACADTLDMDAETLLEKNIREFIPEGGVRTAVHVRQKLMDGSAVQESYDQAVVSKHGIRKVLKMTTNLMNVNGVKGFQHIAKDITEERRMHENLRYYVQQVTRAQEEERARISRELHDSTAQSLIAVLHQVQKFLNGTNYLQVVDYRYLCGIVEQIKSTLQEVRHFSRNLRPSVLDDLGLIPALEWYTEEIRRTHGLVTTFRITGREMRFFPEVEVAFFRIVQEALNNVIRHSGASHAFISFRFSKDTIVLSVRDNGIGFKVPTNYSDLPRLGKLGLAGMHERVRLIGGELLIQAMPQKGTTIRVTAPTAVVTPYEHNI